MGYIVYTNNPNNILALFMEKAEPTPNPDPVSYEYDLTDLELELHDDAISRLNAINPNHKYMTFGFITDLHTPGPNAPAGKGYYIYTALPSIKLLGSIAYDYGIDAVLVGGDLSDGQTLTFQQYDEQMDVIKGYFEQYIPCAYFLTDGNHDRKYDANVEMRTNQQWLARLNSFNFYDGNSVTFAKDVDVYDVNGNKVTETLPLLSYYVDFDKYKVRIASISSYDKQKTVSNAASAQSYSLGLYASLMFSEDKPANQWLFGTFTHSKNRISNNVVFYSKWLNGKPFFTSPTQANSSVCDNHRYDILNSGIKGKGFFGEIAGHNHPVVSRQMYTSGDIQYPVIQTDAAHYGLITKDPSQYTKSNYCFSLFVIRTDQMKLYELEVGKHSNEVENGMHVYDIATAPKPNPSEETIFKFYHISDLHKSPDALIKCEELMDDNSDIEFTLLTGDYANNGQEINIAAAVDEKLHNFRHNLLLMNGNHEGWDTSGWHTNSSSTYNTRTGVKNVAAYLNEVMNNSNIKWGAFNNENKPAVTYYYIDYQISDNSKLRLISIDAYERWFINTAKYSHWKPVYSQQQVDWIISCLVGRDAGEEYKSGSLYQTLPAIDALEENDYVIIAIHEPPIATVTDDSISKLKNANSFCSANLKTGQTFSPNNDIAPIIINGYTHGLSVNEHVLNYVDDITTDGDPAGVNDDPVGIDIEYDFTSTRSNHATFLGYLCGHLHGDLHTYHPRYQDQLIMCIDCSKPLTGESCPAWSDIYNTSEPHRKDGATINEVTLDFTNQIINIRRIGNGSGEDGYGKPMSGVARSTISFPMNK